MPRITFVLGGGERRTVETENGLSLLQVSRDHDIPIEGACEGCLACATCHVIVADDWIDKLPAADEDETDMLDLAIGRTDTSRLGCQIVVTDSLDGLTVALPEGKSFL